MNTTLRRGSALACGAALLLASCTSPYQARMDNLNRAYAQGRVSRGEYRDRMDGLSAADAAWHASNTDTAATVAAIGVAAVGAAALIAATSDHDDCYRPARSRCYTPRRSYYGGHYYSHSGCYY